MSNTSTNTTSLVPQASVKIKMQGCQKFIDLLSADFYCEINLLLKKARHIGTFNIFVRGMVHGHTCPIGLHIVSVTKSGVLITWKNRCNAGIEMALTEKFIAGDTLVSIERFFAELKKADKEILKESEEEDEIPSNVVTLQTPNRDTIKSILSTSPKKKVANGVSKTFMSELEYSLELLMEEASQVADETGIIPKGAIQSILNRIELPWIPQNIAQLVIRGHLIKIGYNWRQTQYRMSDFWIKRFPPKSIQASNNVSLSISALVPIVSAPISQDLSNDLNRLKKDAQKLTQIQEKLEKVTKDLAEKLNQYKILGPQVAKLERRRNKLLTKLESFNNTMTTFEKLR